MMKAVSTWNNQSLPLFSLERSMKPRYSEDNDDDDLNVEPGSVQYSHCNHRHERHSNCGEEMRCNNRISQICSLGAFSMLQSRHLCFIVILVVLLVQSILYLEDTRRHEDLLNSAEDHLALMSGDTLDPQKPSWAFHSSKSNSKNMTEMVSNSSESLTRTHPDKSSNSDLAAPQQQTNASTNQDLTLSAPNPPASISAKSTTIDSDVIPAQIHGLNFNFSQLAVEKIQNYRNGSAIILNVHITHHGGTDVCDMLGHAKGIKKSAPSFACMGVKPEGNVTIENFPEEHPWLHNETATNIALVRPFFHYLSWEFGRQEPMRIADTDWENPNLVSIIVMRDPLSRMLSGDGIITRDYPGIPKNATEDVWWQFATEAYETDNFALRVLAGPGCCDAENTDPMFLERAKDLVRRFTFVLDIDCLLDGLTAVADILGIQINEIYSEAYSPRVHPPIEKRIPFKEVYSYLLKRNHLDIALYEWSKSLSLVKCSALKH